jgi:brefeldin A-inhibited guanine nucleotide-exchange protein
MSAGRLETLTSALERCAAHAADVNGDAELCRRLARATAAAATAVAERPSLLDAVGSYGGSGSGSGVTGRGGGVGAFRFLPDPPLVALEVEASQAALAVLLHLHTAGEEPGGASGGTKGGGNDASQSDAQAAAAAASRHRLAGLAMRILRDFARLASGEGGEGVVASQARDEINARAPLAVDALKALARFSDELFAEKVGEAFPALTALVRCEHAPAEVSRVLGEVFTAKIGPLVIGSLGKS